MIVFFNALVQVDGGADWCSTISLLKQGNISDVSEAVRQSYSSNMSSMGAIVSTWAGTLPSRFSCQLKTQRDYCAEHGCKHYFLEDSPAWEAERNNSAPHWIKVQAMMQGSLHSYIPV